MSLAITPISSAMNVHMPVRIQAARPVSRPMPAEAVLRVDRPRVVEEAELPSSIKVEAHRRVTDVTGPAASAANVYLDHTPEAMGVRQFSSLVVVA
ncbi:MAG: hypothetical protein ACYS8X_10785 [Planctomycetota bacterium]|jgi:hypothetical protein